MKRRIRPDAGAADMKQLPRGPHDRLLCRFCQKEVPVGRITFCSNKCVHEWKLQTNPTYAARELFKRDEGICNICGANTQLIRAKATVEYLSEPNRYTKRDWWWVAAKWPRDVYRRWWEMDHTIPVEDGGGCCGLDNLQTLCVPCHKKKTAEQQRLKALRKIKNTSP